jgi:hypothetical protein
VAEGFAVDKFQWARGEVCKLGVGKGSLQLAKGQLAMGLIRVTSSSTAAAHAFFFHLRCNITVAAG